MNFSHKVSGVRFFYLLVVLLAFSCSEDQDSKVDEILLTVDKHIALSMGDSVLISTEIHNRIDVRLTGITLSYFANDEELGGPIFYPSRKGSFIISARHKEIVSQKQKVDVISLADNITSLSLVYNGNRYLTTEEWSVSGAFSFDVVLDDLNFEVKTNDIELLMNGIPVSARDAIHFAEPGTYEFVASFGSLKSSPILIHVRDKLELEEIEIPVVFHFYKMDPDPINVRKLIDTLNGAFNIAQFKREEVEEGVVNPNAVNMKLKFTAASAAPEGFFLSDPGIHVVPEEIEGDKFSDIGSKYSWDTDEFVNIWLLDEQIDFEDNSIGYEFFGRGGASIPRLFGSTLDGLVTANSDISDPIAGMTVRTISVFGEHPDYIVSTMGYFLGLFGTYEDGCRNEGDFCPDTPTFDHANPDAPTNFFNSCDGYQFMPSNFMSLNRNYRDFTYDQAIRVRTVLEFGISRPGE